MNRKTISRLGFTFSLFALVACGGTSDLTVQQTQVALQQTQVALQQTQRALQPPDSTPASATSQSIGQVSTNGLVLYYPFNGNANDESNNGNAGIVYGDMKLGNDRFGKENSAYFFDGVNDSIVSSLSVPLATEYAVSVWFNYVTSSNSPVLIMRGASRKCRYEPYIAILENMLSFWLSGCDNSGKFTTVNIDPNTWHNMIVNVEGRTQRVYLNNSQVGSGDKIPEEISGYPVVLGAGADSGDNPGGNYFYGVIDDVRVYKRALTEGEVQALYHEGGWK